MVCKKSFWYFCMFFTIFLVLSLTPAMAVELDEVANDAQKYNEESKAEMGFWAKLSFMGKGFKLISKAEQAQSEAETKKEASTDDRSTNQKYDDIWNTQIKKEEQTQELLKFRNKKRILFNPLVIITLLR